MMNKTFDTLGNIWKTGLKIGYRHTQPGLLRGRVMLLNAMAIITSISVCLFSCIYLVIGYQFYYSALYYVPLALAILYLNQVGRFKMAQYMYLFGSLLVIGYWCYEGRRNGNEYTLIALATTATLIFERKHMIVISNLLCAVIYVGYKVLDYQTPFVPDPVLNYEVVPSVILLNTVGVVSFQIAFFRDLAQYYKEKLASQNLDLQKVETELKVSNEEIRTTNEKLSELTNNLETLVKEKTAELQTYIEAINVNMFSTISDLNGIFTMVNDQVVKISGYPREELLGRHYNILASGGHAEAFFAERRKVLMERKAWRGEVEHKTKNGTLLWFDCVVIPMGNHNGEVRNFLTLGLPITERKEHEKMKEATEGLLELIAFRASHNIRGPMARIKGLSDLIQRDLLGEKEYKELAPKFKTCTEELNVATSELVNFVYNHQELLSQDKERPSKNWKPE